MLYLETYKLFKRKLVWVSLIILMILVILPGLSELRFAYFNRANYETLQKEIELFEKHKGTFTDDRIAAFAEEFSTQTDIHDIDSSFLYYFLTDYENPASTPKLLAELYPDVDFPMQFGYFWFWAYWLDEFFGLIRYIPIFIAVAFAPLFSYENECGMQQILLSTKQGRRECTRAKVTIAFIMTNILYIAVFILGIAPLYLLTGGKGGDTSLQMTPWVIQYQPQLDMGYAALLLHSAFLSLIAVNFCLLITLCTSSMAANPMLAMCVTIGVLYIIQPDGVYFFFNNNLTLVNHIVSLSPLSVINTMNLAIQAPVTVGGITIQWLTAAEVFYVVLLAAVSIFFFKVVVKNQKYYAS